MASKSTQEIHTGKNGKIYKDFSISTGKRKLGAEPKNVMVTMILFREKEDEQTERLREKTSTDTPVHVGHIRCKCAGAAGGMAASQGQIPVRGLR